MLKPRDVIGNSLYAVFTQHIS